MAKATFRVPVGPLPEKGKEGQEEKVALDQEEALRVNQFMRTHRYRFGSSDELWDFVKRSIIPPAVLAMSAKNQTTQSRPSIQPQFA